MVLSALINMIRGVSAPRRVVQRAFPKTLTVNDLAPADIALTQNSETIIGEYTIKPQSIVNLGWGGLETERNQGNLYFDLVDSAAAQISDNAEVRLTVTDYNGRVKGVMLAERYVNLKTGVTTPSERFPFPETPVEATQDDKIRLSIINADAGKTLDVSACTLSVSASERWIGR